MPRICPSFICFCLWLGGAAAHAGGWSLRGGGELPGDPLAFDFERKTVTFRDPVTEREAAVPSRSLSLRSRQRLVFHPVFHRGDRGRDFWSPERRRLFLGALAVPAVVGSLGFWAAGWLFAGRRNPILAAIGFVGSWAVMGIFTMCYAFYQIRFGGGGGVILFGATVALVVTPLYVSAVYGCSYWKGLFVLLSHLVASACLLGIVFAATEAVAGKERTETWWTEEVFEPLGLVAPANPDRRDEP